MEYIRFFRLVARLQRDRALGLLIRIPHRWFPGTFPHTLVIFVSHHLPLLYMQFDDFYHANPTVRLETERGQKLMHFVKVSRSLSCQDLQTKVAEPREPNTQLR